MSFSANGIPWRAPRYLPAAISASASRAWLRARSNVRVMNACVWASYVSTRRISASTSSTGESLREAISPDSSAIERSWMSVDICLGLRGPLERQRERERRACADLALHPDLSAMELDELPRESQPEPGAFLLGGARPDLTECLEHRLVSLRRDADPRASDGHLDRSAVRNSRHVDQAAFRRELDGVR